MIRSAQTPTLSILVATWNCAGQLAEFLASLAEQTYPDWELLLLDNASSDGTAELGQRHQQAFPAQRPQQRFDWKVVRADVSHTRSGLVFAETFRAQRCHQGLAPSAACWALNWAQYGRRKPIGLG